MFAKAIKCKFICQQILLKHYYSLSSSLRYRITKAQFTTVQKPHQGVSRKRAVYRFRVAFFRSFFPQKKKKEQKLIGDIRL